MSSAEKERQLVEKVELRLALADTDDKFEAALARYLGPILLKFASPHAPVRAQVAKTVRFLLTKINASPNMKIPVESLIAQVQNPQVPEGADPAMVQSYTLVFLSKAISRLPQDEQELLIPTILTGMHQTKSIISARLFNILCKLIVNYNTSVPNVDDGKKFREFLQLDGKNSDEEEYLLDKFGQFMLLQPVRPNEQGQIPNGFSLPGLSKEQCAFFTYDAGVTFDANTLVNYKKSILNFIQYGFGKGSKLVLLLATADPASAVSDVATNLLRRSNIDYEDPEFVDDIVALFLGDPAKSQPPARRQLQEKIMGFLAQSKYAAKSPDVGKLMSVGLNSDYTKLKSSTIKFIRSVTTQMAEESLGGELNEDIASQLRTNLQVEKQSEVSSNLQDYLLQRRYQYEALGLLLKRSPKLEDVSYIKFLFEMLQTEIPELRPSAQEALSGLAIHLEDLSDPDREQLKQLLKGIIQRPVPVGSSDQRENDLSARYMATKFVNSAFPFNDPEARLLDIEVQTKDDKPETLEEATKGLHPYWFRVGQSTKQFKSTSELVNPSEQIDVPSFDSMVRYISTGSNVDKAITFTLQCLVMEAVKGHKTVIVDDREWENRINNAIDFDETVRSLLKDKLVQLSAETVDVDGDSDMVGESENALDSFLKIGFDYFLETLNLDVGKRFAKILSLAQPSTVSRHVRRVPELVRKLADAFSTDAALYISQILGILCSNEAFSDADVKSTVDQLIQLEDVRPLGYIISRLNLTGRNIISAETFTKVLDLLKTQLSLASSSKSKASLDSISQLAMFGCLGPKSRFAVDDYLPNFIDTIQPWIKKRQDDLTAMSWCFLGLTETVGESEELTSFEQTLYDSHTTKHVDYLFSTGEAFSVLAAGWDSKLMEGKIDVQGEHVDIETLIPKRDRVSIILETFLDSCNSTKPTLRRAGCIWLLSLVQFCGKSDAVKAHLNEIQVAFMKFLVDREDLVQESASRGLSIVYEMGDYELQDELVHNLLLSFTDSNKASHLMSGSVGEETTLFEPGVLNTNDGSVSTYKDILNLASEVGDPSLVYKFMSLAKNSALWSSRKGLAYGLGAVLDKSKLDEMLKKDDQLAGRLIPKLYRYRFDPSPSVSKTMDDIWNTLIVDSHATIKDNFDTILAQLLKDMGNREWKTRQASAAALLDLVSQSPLERYENKLEKIWSMAFRSMDDIKESVRKEGNQLTRYLATTMVRKISDNKKGSEESLKQLIPFLLGNNGLLSDAEDVKKFAFDTILKIADTASVSLKPFVNEMIEQMVLLMSSVEPQVVNYLSLNADKYKLKSEDLDVQRLNMVGTSPMMGAIEKLMNLLDESLMPDFLSKLSNAVKTSVGLPSKVTGSKVIVDLMVKHFFIAQDFGDDLLKIAMTQLKDRNDTVSGSYAIAAGYAIKSASAKKTRGLSRKLIRYYFEAPADNNHLQKVASRASTAVAEYSKDKFQSIAAGFLPLAFIAKHDLDDTVAEGFKKTWNSSIGSGSTAIKLYFAEILELIKTHIDTTNFAIRQAIGLSIIEIIDRLGPQIGTMDKYLGDLYEVLLESLKGRSYKGKENLLNSLVLLAINTKDYLKDHPELYERVAQTILTEARKKNKEYKRHSIKSLGKFLGSSAHDTELYDTYLELVDPLLHPSTDSDDDDDSDYDGKMDTDDHKKNDQKKIKLAKFEEFRNSLVENVVISINRDEPNMKVVAYLLKELLEISNDESTFKTKLVVMNVLTQLINKLDHANRLAEERAEIFAVWQNLTRTCTKEDELQSVLVHYIRLTKLIYEKCASDEQKQSLSASLETIKKLEVNSVVTTEAQKAISSLQI